MRKLLIGAALSLAICGCRGPEQAPLEVGQVWTISGESGDETVAVVVAFYETRQVVGVGLVRGNQLEASCVRADGVRRDVRELVNSTANIPALAGGALSAQFPAEGGCGEGWMIFDSLQAAISSAFQ
jgi:hypothetical protein